MTGDWKPLRKNRDGRYTDKSKQILIKLAEEMNITLSGKPAALRPSNCTDGHSASDCYGFWAVLYAKENPKHYKTETWADMDRFLRGESRVEFDRFYHWIPAERDTR